MASPELDASTANDNLGLSSMPDSGATNYQSDTEPTDDGSDGVTNSLDNIFKYAKDATDLAKSVGIIGGAAPTQASVNPNGTIQPTGANPVVQTKASTTAQSWIKANPVLAGAIALGVIGGSFLIYKAIK